MTEGEGMEMQILPLSRAGYKGYPFTAVYWTDAYYEIAPTDQGFSLCRRDLPAPERKSFSDTLFGGWLEAALAAPEEYRTPWAF